MASSISYSSPVFCDSLDCIIGMTTIVLPSFVSTQLHICGVFAWMHPVCINNWTWLGPCGPSPGTVPFLPFCCKLSESLTHHGSRFLEGEAEKCRKPAFRCKSGTGPNMQWHGTTWLRFWTVQTHDSQRSRVWPESPLCAISIHFYPCFGFDIFARLFIASPFIEKRAIYIHHGVRAGWPSSTFHTAQDEVKRLLEEFAAYTLANAKAEVAECRFACCTIVFSWNTNSGS